MKIQQINQTTPGGEAMYAWRVKLPNGITLTVIGAGLDTTQKVEAYIREKFTRIFKGGS